MVKWAEVPVRLGVSLMAFQISALRDQHSVIYITKSFPEDRQHPEPPSHKNGGVPKRSLVKHSDILSCLVSARETDTKVLNKQHGNIHLDQLLPPQMKAQSMDRWS